MLKMEILICVPLQFCVSHFHFLLRIYHNPLHVGSEAMNVNFFQSVIFLYGRENSRRFNLGHKKVIYDMINGNYLK